MKRRWTGRARKALFSWALACTIVAPPVFADEARVLIYAPTGAGPLLEEALIRIRGELRAVGLAVEVRATNDDFSLLEGEDFGAIVLGQESARIEIRAFARGLDAPVTQSAHTSHPGTNAEVVAIRAVEALRAAMIQYARNRPPTDSLPAPVGDFTRLAPAPEPDPPPLPETPPVPPESASPEDISEPFSAPPAWAMWLGPTAVLEMPDSVVLAGVHGAVWWKQSWLRFGLSGSQTLSGGQVEEPEGSISLRRGSVHLLAGAELELSARGFLFVAVGTGIAHYTARVDAAPGYSGATTTHQSVLIGGQLGGGYWLSERVGIYGLVASQVLTSAPRLRFDGRDVGLAGRPTAALSGGIMLGL